MVRTGDQPVERVSRHMAPFLRQRKACHKPRRTHGLTADIRMPDLGSKLHDRRSKRIFAWNVYINIILSPLVRRSWRTTKRASQFRYVAANRFCLYLGLCVRMEVGKFFRDPAGFV